MLPIGGGTPHALPGAPPAQLSSERRTRRAPTTTRCWSVWQSRVGQAPGSAAAGWAPWGSAGGEEGGQGTTIGEGRGVTGGMGPPVRAPNDDGAAVGSSASACRADPPKRRATGCIGGPTLGRGACSGTPPALAVAASHLPTPHGQLSASWFSRACK